MKKLRRFVKSAAAIMFAFLVVATSVFSASFVSRAENQYTVESVHNEPAYGDNSGYLNLLVKNLDGTLSLHTIAWNMVLVGDNTTTNDYTSFSFYISGGSVMFNVTSSAHVYVTAFHLKDNGSADLLYSSGSSPEYVYSSSVVLNGNVLACSMKGNYVNVGYFNGTTLPQVSVIWNTEAVQINELIKIYDELRKLYNNNSYMIGQINSIISQMNNLFQALSDLKKLQESSNTWLERIWTTIQEFVTSGSDDQQKVDDFNAETGAQKSEIDSLNEQNQTQKVEVNSAVSDVEANISYDNMAQYGGVLATITNNEYVLELILVVVSIAIISYVLFGKR